ncbi:MAG TPA: SgcJ/EcaC family oxidoreductase [Pseudonocardiaceae bacterium]|nr:SgcJ/EcaC family oxidoreductase [Pseudonocardiaceae bacterium]
MKLAESLYDLPRTLLGAHVRIVKQARLRDHGRPLADRIARIEADQDIRAVINQYAYCYDEGDLDGLMEIYSDDCRLVNNKGTFVGTDAIRANYQQNIHDRTFGYHHVTDVQLVLDDTATTAWASGFLYNVAVRKQVATGTMANCLFHLTVRDGRWQVIESRIAIGNRHEFAPRNLPATTPPPYATDPATVDDLIDEIS